MKKKLLSDNPYLTTSQKGFTRVFPFEYKIYRVFGKKSFWSYVSIIMYFIPIFTILSISPGYFIVTPKIYRLSRNPSWSYVYVIIYFIYNLSSTTSSLSVSPGYFILTKKYSVFQKNHLKLIGCNNLCNS